MTSLNFWTCLDPTWKIALGCLPFFFSEEEEGSAAIAIVAAPWAQAAWAWARLAALHGWSPAHRRLEPSLGSLPQAPMAVRTRGCRMIPASSPAGSCLLWPSQAALKTKLAMAVETTAWSQAETSHGLKAEISQSQGRDQSWSQARPTLILRPRPSNGLTAETKIWYIPFQRVILLALVLLLVVSFIAPL